MIGGMIRCGICGNPILPEAAEECACGRDVCERCSNHHNSGEFDCCDICRKKRKARAERRTRELEAEQTAKEQKH